MSAEYSHRDADTDATMTPTPAGAVMLDPELRRLVELKVRQDRAVTCLLLGVMLLIFSIIARPGATLLPPMVRDANGIPVLDARGNKMFKPTLGHYVMQALLPWNMALEAGLGLIVTAGVVRFRRPRPEPDLMMGPAA